jgi:adenylate cyclase
MISDELSNVLDARLMAADGRTGATLPAVVQAYSRGLARIVAAEAEMIRELIAEVPEEERAGVLNETLRVLLPAARNTLASLHETMLHDALVTALAPPVLETSGSEPLAIALVDLCSSTTHLVAASVAEVERAVDALFEAGEAVTAGRAVQTVKYVGDGFFLAGAEPEDVAMAALDAMRRIRRLLPLEVRAGLAHGEVIRRAGDVFGLPVNYAQLLTKAAVPGTLLADDQAARLLPERLRGSTRTLALHPEIGELLVTEIVVDVGVPAVR